MFDTPPLRHLLLGGLAAAFGFLVGLLSRESFFSVQSRGTNLLLLFLLALVLALAALILIAHLRLRTRSSRALKSLARHLARFDPFAAEQALPPEIAGGNQELAEIINAIEAMMANARESQARLKENELLFRTVTEFALDWAYWLDPQGNLLYNSPICERITGYSLQEFSSDPALLMAIVHPDDQRLLADHRDKVRLTDAAHPPVEYRICTKEGQVKWLSHVCRGIFGEHGEFIGIRGSNTDITERKTADRVLRESRERLQALFEQAADAIFVHELEGRFLDANPQACRLLGYTREELLALSVFEIEAGSDRQAWLQRWQKVEKGGVVAAESSMIRKDGSHVAVATRHTLVQWGSEGYLLAFVRDVSAAKEAQDELDQERELLSVTLDSMGEGMIAACREGRIVLLNKMAEALTGWREEEAVGKPLDEVYQRLDEPTGRRRTGLVEEVLSQGGLRTPSRESILISKKGGRRFIKDICSPIRDHQEGAMGVAIVFRDISAQRQLEKEALKTEKLEALGILAGGIAHDFNNLLTAVLGNITLAKLHADPHSRIINHLAAAEKASLRTRDLTQQLLTFARGGAPIKELTALGELIRQAASFVLRGSKVELDLALQQGLRGVEVDQGQMSQVFNSLLLNAAQAMGGNGTIEVRAENVDLDEASGLPLAPGPYVKITVMDQGKGISAEHLPHIFDPYYTTNQHGSGLGLASSYSMVKRHEGHLGVESQVGQGTIFTIHLPASRRQPATEPHEAEAVRKGEGRVLVMDDESMIREMAGDLLGYLGYTVDFASSGEEAVSGYEKAHRAGDPYRLVILDLTVPNGMSGREAVRWILDLDPVARVVVSSGFPQDPIMVDYEKYGFSGALAKPYNLKELVRTINRLLG